MDRHTVCTISKLNDIADADVDDAQETLILLLELLLVEDLDRQYAVLVCAEVKALVPVGVQGPFRDRRRLGLLPIDGGDGEGVREAYFGGYGLV